MASDLVGYWALITVVEMVAQLEIQMAAMSVASMAAMLVAMWGALQAGKTVDTRDVVKAQH